MKKIRKITLFTILMITIQILSIPRIFAASRDYTVNDGIRIPISETYTVSNVISNIANNKEDSIYLREPEDIFINVQGFLYVADTGNHRIVKMDRDGMLLGEYYGPREKPLKSPKGVYVDEDGGMFVADTGNQRIVHLSSEGEYIEEFIKPESELLGSNFNFDPSKICVGPTGYIYAVKGQVILTIDAYNRFRGYVGQTEIGFRFVDFLTRLFASEDQKRYITRRTAAPYINMAMDEKGVLYATSLDKAEGEIKKLNSVGKNIYRKYGNIKSESSISLFDSLFKVSLETKSFTFGERRDDDNNVISPMFKDITVDVNGMVTVIEGQTGKIYQYDPDGNLLTVFGGKGNQKGKFASPEAIEKDRDGRIYILDRVNANIQIFEPTKFIKTVHQATVLYSMGEYKEAFNKWKEVLAIDESYQLARFGIANTFYKQGEWKTAMEEYVLADDRVGYSNAFAEFRYGVFRKYFALVVLALVASVLVLVYVVTKLRSVSEYALDEFGRSSKKMDIREGLLISLGIVFRPLEVFESIKNGRERLNLIPGVIILFMVLATRLFNILIVHYPLADVDVRNANLMLEAVKLLLPAVTWVIASFAVTAILDGESKLREIFLIASYCMIPYILITLPLTVLSRVLSRNEIAFYALVSNGTWIWILLLFFLSLKSLNDYSVVKTAVTYFVSGVTMVLIWLVSILSYVLTGKLYQFISGILHEIRMTWL